MCEDRWSNIWSLLTHRACGSIQGAIHYCDHSFAWTVFVEARSILIQPTNQQTQIEPSCC